MLVRNVLRHLRNHPDETLYFDLRPYPKAFDIEAGGGFTHGLHERFNAEVLDGKVGWTNRR